MTDIKVRPTTPSDRPPEDLKKERDAFIQQFFRKGAQFTEDLLKENERLRERIADLEQENGRMRAHLASDEAIRDLLRKIEELEHEKKDLVNRSVRAEAVKDNFTTMYEEVEGELAELDDAENLFGFAGCGLKKVLGFVAERQGLLQPGAD